MKMDILTMPNVTVTDDGYIYKGYLIQRHYCDWIGDDGWGDDAWDISKKMSCGEWGYCGTHDTFEFCKKIIDNWS